jgi:hypothetical protein
MAKMGLQFGLESGKYCKRSNRWMFKIDGILGDENDSANALPPSKSSRPQIAFSEINVRHLIEDVFFPGKPDWKPITITIFDLMTASKKNPVWNWLTEYYNPEKGILQVPNDKPQINEGFIRECSLDLYDGCGEVIEQWIYQDAWPQQINFSTLDYQQTDILMMDVTLRYSRAYVK